MADGSGWGGWIKLYRKLMYSEIWKNPKLLKFWLWCLLKASSKETSVMVGNQFVTLQPGQFITGRAKAAEANGISEKTAERYLCVLENGQMLTRKVTNKFTLVTIENWRVYQFQDFESDQQMTNKRPTNDHQSTQQMTTYKNNKNIKNIKKDKNKGSTSSKRKNAEEDETPISWNWDDIPYGVFDEE